MNFGVYQALYIVSAGCFILALKWMSSPAHRAARRSFAGNSECCWQFVLHAAAAGGCHL